MTIKMRLTSLLAASVLAASAGLVTGFAAAPAGAVPPGPTDEQVCTEDCGPDDPEPPTGPGGFEVCTEDCGPDDPDPGDPDPEDPGDAPIPADANFTG
jgi:hypothetical protein